MSERCELSLPECERNATTTAEDDGETFPVCESCLARWNAPREPCVSGLSSVCDNEGYRQVDGEWYCKPCYLVWEAACHEDIPVVEQKRRLR